MPLEVVGEVEKQSIKFDFGDRGYDKVDKAKVKYRLVSGLKEFKVYRQDSKFKDINEIFGGGLPMGLTVFVGEAGTGKSLLAKTIAKRYGKDCLYVFCESKTDYPGNGVQGMNYRKFLPFWDKAIQEVFYMAEQLGSRLIVIDSATTFLSGTKKAVEEAEIRGGLFDIAEICEDKIPVIAISQVRGSGGFIYPAGGQAVSHAPVLYIWFHRNRLTNFTAEQFQGKIGEIKWSIDIQKDKEGVAQQGNEFIVHYDEKGEPSFSRISFSKSKEDLRI